MGVFGMKTAKSDSSAVSPHWSKDFVEHLRTVHFALMLASTILIVTATNRAYLRYSAALTQLQQIRDFQAQWSSVPRLVYLQAMKAANVRPSWAEGFYLPRSSKRDDFRDYVTTEVSADVLTGSRPWRLKVTNDLPPDQSVRDEWEQKQATLGDFMRTWNTLALKGHMALVFPATDHPSCNINFARTNSYQNLIRPFDLDCKFPTVTGKEYNGKYSSTFVNADSIDFHHGFSGLEATIDSTLPTALAKKILADGSNVRALTTVRVDFYSWEVDESTLANALAKDWKTGPFWKAFPELTSVSNGLTDTPIGEAIIRLSNRAPSDDKSISMLGFNVPVEQLSQWGLVVLIALQLYFWLHLHELTGRLAPDAEGWNVAWIGVYRTRAALGAVFISCLLLPVLAAMALVNRFAAIPYYDKQIMIVLCFGVVTCGGIGVLTVWRLMKLRKSLPTTVDLVERRNAFE